MSGFNKVTSFVLGLIVVLVFLFVFGSRVNLSDKLMAFKDSKVTPTPAVVIVTPTPTTKKKGFFESLFARKATPTPTPAGQTPSRDSVGTSPLGGAKVVKVVENNTQNSTVFTTPPADKPMTSQPQTIPQTGSPTILLPILVSALGSGLYLRKRS